MTTKHLKLNSKIQAKPEGKIVPRDWLEAHGLSLTDINHLEMLEKMQRKNEPEPPIIMDLEDALRADERRRQRLRGW